VTATLSDKANLTPDLGGTNGTKEMAEAIIKAL
jgi:isocitrate/isopropylmalate dehydrogenase